MFYRITVAIAALALFAPAALAQVTPHTQPPEEFKFLSAKDLGALVDKPGPGPQVAYFGDHENYYVQYVTRTDTGNKAEIHVHWTHYLFVLSGEATLTYGGKVSDAADSAPGEVRGSGITGGNSVTIHPGDYLQIPAGLPHMLNPAKGTKLNYVTFNTRQ